MATLEELIQELNERFEKRKRTPILSSIIDMYYTVVRFLRDLPYNTRLAWQRVTRGWDDSQVWGFYSSHTEHTIAQLTQFRNEIQGAPSELFENDSEDPFRLWREVIDEIIDGFEAARELGSGDYRFEDSQDDKKDVWHIQRLPEEECKKLEEALEARFTRGLFLFHKYYFNLWD